ncbi:MAG: Uma2 family endonuclease [Chloroflexi bacterium]|nr:Uma2 family endonuclease [Chloroflexota bacterium]
MAISGQHLTLEAFLRLPEQEPALEFKEGKVTQKVSPTGRHSRLQTVLVERLNRFAEPRKLALAFSELRTTFGGASSVPDVAVYRWDRIPVDEQGQVVDTFVEPPDLAVEIASPGQSTTGLVRRCLWYVANGVQVALLVDPDDESVLVFRAEQAPQALRGPDKLGLGDVLPGFELSAQEIFDSLRVY